MFKTIQILFVSLTAAILLTACGPSQQDAEKLGFANVPEMKEIQAKGFQTKEAYEVNISGFSSAQEMKLYQDQGYKTKQEYDEAQNKLEAEAKNAGWESYEEKRQANLKNIDNPREYRASSIDFALNCKFAGEKYIVISVNDRASLITDGGKNPSETKAIELKKIKEDGEYYDFEPITSYTFNGRSVYKLSINRHNLDIMFFDYPDGKPYYALSTFIALVSCSASKDKVATLERAKELLGAKVDNIKNQEDEARRKDDELRKKAKI
ncbi:hypothetical protein PSHI8_24080 [Polynucleobacter sp. SHI8]|uniref:hypothetical protein n=1 Tax=unclassified Polynucleobacter TaxID=2640945 RepID=UPI0024923CB8|nr:MULTISPECIES: hypothetical protein [unclassified Polynucleobacter]BDW12324.1 hypothetical protein PSHI2_24060 [Polynucleobacter sp. SHI2]BDW14772.1 hypothetical protein PSHI8_24080 [Polynucleobacter sp. SHI8]